MEKITVSLHKINQTIIKIIRERLFPGNKDCGWDITIQGSSLQYNYYLNFYDQLALSIKVYPHKSSLKERIYRVEISRTDSPTARGKRISVREFSVTPNIFQEIYDYFSYFIPKGDKEI